MFVFTVGSPFRLRVPQYLNHAANHALFARFFGTMSLSDSLITYVVGLRPWPFPPGPVAGGAFSGSPGSRAWSFHTCLGSSTPPRWPATRVTATCHVAFPYKPLGRHVEMVISELYSLPACAPVNASAGVLPPPPHDSGSGWFAIPFLYDSFIRYSMPVYPGAFGLSRREHNWCATDTPPPLDFRRFHPGGNTTGRATDTAIAT